MKYVIYHSTASIYFRTEMLDEMIKHFKTNNSKNDITGLLLYSKGFFLQLIEGEEKPLNRLIKLIQKDKMHHSLIILAQANTESRIFPTWSMGYKSISEEQFANVKQLLQQNSNSLGFTDIQTHPVLDYIKNFAADPLKMYK